MSLKGIHLFIYLAKAEGIDPLQALGMRSQMVWLLVSCGCSRPLLLNWDCKSSYTCNINMLSFHDFVLYNVRK